jgi:hypothetical protein
MVENIFRNFQARPEQTVAALQQLSEEHWGEDPTRERPGFVGVCYG